MKRVAAASEEGDGDVITSHAQELSTLRSSIDRAFEKLEVAS